MGWDGMRFGSRFGWAIQMVGAVMQGDSIQPMGPGHSKGRSRAIGEKKTLLVGGFKPFEIKYSSKLISSPNRGENKQYLKPPPSLRLGF